MLACMSEANGSSVITKRDWAKWAGALALQAVILLAGNYAVLTSRLAVLETKLHGHRELVGVQLAAHDRELYDLRQEIKRLKP